jgi:hypothetical protein
MAKRVFRARLLIGNLMLVVRLMLVHCKAATAAQKRGIGILDNAAG